MSLRRVRTVRPTTIINQWNLKPRLAAIELMNKYGDPDEGSKNVLLWRNRFPWTEIYVENTEVLHDFPTLHTESCTFKLQHDVPLSKVEDLLALNSSVAIDRTKGQLRVRAENEEMAILELNMAEQLLHTAATVPELREKLTLEALRVQQGTPSLLAQQLVLISPPTTESKVRIDTEELKQEVEEIGERIKQLGERIKDAAQT